MMHRYFLIEPLYADLDSFCNITVGSGRVRSNIQIYPDSGMLADVAAALVAPELSEEFPVMDDAMMIFNFRMSVLPNSQTQRVVRFQFFQHALDDGAPFYSDIRFEVSMKAAAQLAGELERWLLAKQSRLEWKP